MGNIFMEKKINKRHSERQIKRYALSMGRQNSFCEDISSLHINAILMKIPNKNLYKLI